MPFLRVAYEEWVTVGNEKGEERKVRKEHVLPRPVLHIKTSGSGMELEILCVQQAARDTL